MLKLQKGTELRGDRYVVHDVIGTGGFASVWKASDKQLNRDVALKRLLKPSIVPSPESISALKDEAQKHARLVEEGEPLMVME